MKGSKKMGRPPAERAPWNPETFRSIYRCCFTSVDELAELLSLPRHVVYAWTADFAGKAPTPEQREAVATVLSVQTGTKIRPADLARSIDSIRFRFVD
jgi:hypothetical protein|tara:strand:+ start:2399 stop:2692 length:294 start_codon:yes stop_codon:yes gene_type:complete